MEFLKSAVLLANEHQSDQKKMLQMIFLKNFSLYWFTQKDPVNGMQENVTSKRILTQTASLSIS